MVLRSFHQPNRQDARPLHIGVAIATVSFLLPGAASADTPLQYLTTQSAKSEPVVHLTWGVLAISCSVIAIIAVLVLWGVLRGERSMLVPGGMMPVARPTGGVNWIWIGVGISSLVLLLTVIWTVIVLAEVNTPRVPPAPFVIEVSGHQWWWEVRYVTADPGRIFTTANEIHIPTGVPVQFKLIGSDVIHSFWIPALSGKTDVIPGQTNLLWLDAKTPGTYRGQCAEYCGVQHAHMSILLVADTPAEFQQWWWKQLASARPPASVALSAGRDAFVVHCGGCHTVRGTDAAGILGPDLSHLASRKMIAANSFPNTRGYLSGWISDPQAMKPGSLMPRLELSGEELTGIRNYLETLN
jgi:cytochrome c oxidase subunit 2